MAKHTSTADLRGRSTEDLATFIRTTTKELLDARFQNYANRLNDTSRVSRLRRDLARALTVQSEHTRTGAAAPAAKVEGQ
jgi:ribosomal protein L29